MGKVFPKNLENFAGVDLRSSDLTRKENFARSCKNGELSNGMGLRKRDGVKIVGQAGAFFKGGKISKYDRQTGEITTEILGLAHHLFRLKRSSITVTRVAGSTTWDLRIIDNSPISPNQTLILEQGAAVYASLSLGNPLAAPNDPGYTTIWDVAATISPTANFSCTFPLNSAEVLSVASSYVYNISTTFGNTLPTVSDILPHLTSLPNIPSIAGVANLQDDCKLVAAEVVATTASTVTLSQVIGNAVLANCYPFILGPGAAPAASLTSADIETVDSNTKTISFYYWEPVPYFSSRMPTNSACYTARMTPPIPYGTETVIPVPANVYTTGGVLANIKQLPVILGANNNAYVFSWGRGDIQSTVFETTKEPHDGFPYKYDGQSFYRAGLPKPSFSVASVGVTDIAQRSFVAVAEFTDNNGVLIESQPSDPLEGDYGTDCDFNFRIPFNWQVKAYESVTVAGTPSSFNSTNIAKVAQANDRVIVQNNAGRIDSPKITAVNKSTDLITTDSSLTGTVALNSPVGLVDGASLGFKFASAKITAGTVDSNTITVGFHSSIEIGDTIYVWDMNAPATGGDTISAVVTNKGATTLTLDKVVTTDITIPETSYVSTIAVSFYRTKAGGNLHYRIKKVPVPSWCGAAIYELLVSDNVADANLGEQLLEPEIGKERDLPPKAAIGCLHQGTIVYADIAGQPNTIAWADTASNLEAVPLASNYTDVPSTDSGSVTAALSDSEDRLIIAKPAELFSVTGDLVGGLFSAQVMSSDGVGISTQSSLVRVKNGTFAYGGNGPFLIQQGQIFTDFAKPVYPAFKKISVERLSKGCAFLDKDKRRVVLVPSVLVDRDASEGTPGDTMWVFDYGNEGIWWDWETGVEQQWGGGGVYDDGDLFVFSSNLKASGITYPAIGGCFRRLKEPLDVGSNTLANYHDNYSPVEWEWIPAWEALGDIDANKSFLRLRFFSFYNPLDEDSRTTSLSTISIYKNYYTGVAHFTSSINFSTTAQFEATLKLRSDKMRALQFKLTNSQFNKSQHISGYTFDVTTDYEKDDLAD